VTTASGLQIIDTSSGASPRSARSENTLAVHGAISSKEFASSEAVARGVKPTNSEILVGY
jgi:hypothetical protein